MKRKKVPILISLICLALIVAVMPFVGACAPTPKIEPTPERPVEIICQLIHPRPQFLTQTVHLPYLEGFEEKSGGRIKMTVYDAGGVVDKLAVEDAVAANTLQMGYIELYAEPGRHPLGMVMSQPLIAPSSTVGSLVVWHLYEEFSECQAEYSDEIIFLSHFVSASYQFHMIDKPIKSVADLEGLRIIGIDPFALKALEGLGAIPMQVHMLDSYEALDKGMADGILCPLAPIKALKMSEVVKHHTIVNQSYTPFGIVFNRSVFDSLPKDLQELLIDESGAKISEACGMGLDVGSLNDCEWMKEQGARFYSLPPAEMAKLVEIVSPLRDAWVAETEAEGLIGKKIMEEALRYSQELADKGIYIPEYPTE
ncbi:hypothetical protein ES703_30471 [subsurface metagenome]